jgi:hypothetical protein
MTWASVFHRGSALGVVALLLAASTPDDAQAQRLFGFGGIEVRGGVADLDDVDSAVNYAFDLDIGYLFLPALRTYLRFEGFRGDFDTDVIAGGGNLDGAGIETGLRYDLLPTFFVSPYGVIGANFSNIKASDVTDQTATDLPDGVHTSFVYGLGAALHLGQRLSLTADARRLSGDRGVERTLYSVGLRFCPKGFDMYKR